MESPEILAKCFNVTAPDLDCPALKPPPGVMALDPNPASIAPALEHVAITCLVLVTFAISIRLFTRLRIMKLFALEDAMMILAAISFVVYIALTFESIAFGLGKHQWDLTVEETRNCMVRVYAAQIAYCFSIFTAKIGVLLQVKHIFTGKKSTFVYWASWAVIVMVVCAYTASLFIWIFPCM